ncbi:tRNA-intron lyase [Geoglobus ahangari]|nr:tRNA-intron lyase [Geoglobus ahangari]
MKGQLSGDRVTVDFSQRLITRRFGRREGDRVVLLPEEAAYLVHKGTLEVYDGKKAVDFNDLFSLCDPVRYFVYADLRDRGVRADFGDMGEYLPVSEDDVFETSDLLRRAGKKLAVVDSEAEVTYFLLERFDGTGNHSEELREFEARFANGFFVTDYLELHRKYFYGVQKGNRVVLSIFEALYLMEEGFLSSSVDEEKVLSFGRQNVLNFERRYAVYKDLRERRFMVKTGFKFGSDFRVYEYVRSVSELRHSKYLVKLREAVSMMELACDVRLSSAVNKTVLYPVFRDGRPEYLAVRRVKM